MSIKSFLCHWPALLLAVLLSGCVTEDVVIHLNSDGSGTVEYTTHFDRAPDELREQIRKQMQSPGMCRMNSRESILENYPTPHFQLLEFENDLDALHTRIRMEFQDINALLIPRNEAALGLEDLDFSVQGDQLIFSLKVEKPGQPWPDKFDETPGLKRITIINSQTGDPVVFEQELTSTTPPADWSETLVFSGHQIERKPSVQVFHDYPVVKPPVCEVEQAKWLLRQHRQWSSLDLDLLVDFPDDGNTYIRWEKPVVMSGEFLPSGVLQSIAKGSASAKGEFERDRFQKIELGFAVPTNRVDALSASTVRIRAHRCSGSSVVEVGKLRPNTEYAVGSSTLKTAGMENNRVSFTLTGEADRLKNAFVKTKRGNRFMLKRASWSSGGADKTTVTYWELLPVEDCTLLLELHNKTERCYIDLSIPSINLTQRAWRTGSPEEEPVSNGWKKRLAAEHPELFEIETPPIKAEMFEEKDRYKAYFQGLKDLQLIPAIIQVVDYMLLHEPDNGQYWIQEIARSEIAERRAYLEASRDQISDQLFALYLHLPEKMICLTTFFSSLGLAEVVQPMAVEQLGQGNMRFANDSFFGRELSSNEVEVLKGAFAVADSWVDQKELLEILDRAGHADAAFINRTLNDQSMQEFVRGAALRIALKDEANAADLAQRIALDSAETSNLRSTALGYLMSSGDFPTEELSACIADSDCRASAVQQLDQHLSNVLRMSKNSPAEKTAQRVALEPLIPLLQDLAEQLKEYDAKPSASVLEKIEQLDAPSS